MGPIDLVRAANPLGLWPGDEESASAFERMPLRCEDFTIGSVDRALVVALQEFPEVLRITAEAIEVICPGPVRRRSAAFAEVTRKLFERGFVRGWRDELQAVWAYEEGPKLFEIERAATRFFGVLTQAAHLNGVSGKGMWIARRSADKSVDPGLLDNLVGGGVAAGLSVHETLLKEAWEEAGLEPARMIAAQFASAIGVCRLTEEGLQREILYAHDLVLPADFTPQNQDGEVAEVRLLSLNRVADALWTGEFTLDAGLVALDFLIRHEYPGITPGGRDGLDALCRRPC
jgi:8-oxo-dGTP pyrophosphatase MutT (NUDIX family)